MKHTRKEGTERKNDRRRERMCSSQVTAVDSCQSHGGSADSVDRISEGCHGWIESSGEPLTLAPHIDWSHSETLTLLALQLHPSLEIFPKDSRKEL